MTNDMFDSDSQDASFIDLGETPLLDAHASDMHGAVADPEQTPKAPDGTAEGVLVDGRPIDLMGDTPAIDREVVMSGLDPGGLTGETDLPDLGNLGDRDG